MDETTHYVNQFKMNLELGLQQRGSRLRNAMTIESGLTGEGAVATDLVLPVEAQKRTERYGDTPNMGPNDDRVWYFPEDFEWGRQIDHIDKLRKLADPTSAYTSTAINALGRSMDRQIIIPSFFGGMRVGKAGASTRAFSATHTVDTDVGGTGTNLNTEKMAAALELLQEAEVDVDAEPLWAAITPSQHTALLNDSKAQSSDFNNSLVLVDGRVRNWMGFNIIVLNQLPKTGAVRDVPIWAQSGMLLGLWDDFSVQGAVDPGKKFNFQLYAKFTAAATRSENGKVIKVQCTEA